MKPTVQYYLSRNVHEPVRGTNQAAGIDLYIPFYSEEFENDLKAKNFGHELGYRHEYDSDGNISDLIITIPPQERVNIPSGVHVFMEPKESALIAANKSGVSTKKGLVFTCQVIDSDYTGEIHMGLVNTSRVPVEVKTGDKLIQFIHTPVYFSDLRQVDSKEDYLKMHEGTKRGDGAFGSTDKENK
jgi:dUTP pyrophosphatase